MIGKLTATPNCSWMLRIQARWEYRLSTDRASNSHPIAAKRAAAFEKATNSLVQTGVKSAGCENSSSHLPR